MSEHLFARLYAETKNAFRSYCEAFDVTGLEKSTIKQRAARLAKRMSPPPGDTPPGDIRGQGTVSPPPGDTPAGDIRGQGTVSPPPGDNQNDGSYRRQPSPPATVQGRGDGRSRQNNDERSHHKNNNYDLYALADRIKSTVDIIDVISPYVPDLKRVGKEWAACCPFHTEETPSFRVSQDKRPQVWNCFGCDDAGDVITFIERQHGLRFPDAVKFIALHHGLADHVEDHGHFSVPKVATASQTATLPDPVADQQANADDGNHGFALSTWEKSVPDAPEVAAYLMSRGITTPPPACLRYHAWKNMMVALAVDENGAPQAIHRTFLAQGTPPDQRKKMLGPVKGCTIRLGDPDDTLAIGEGIETCLSFSQATGIPTWAAMSTSLIKRWNPPTGLKKLYILADIDPPAKEAGKPGRQGQKAARDVADRLAESGLEVAIVWPGDPEGDKVDFNDLLKSDPTGESIRQAMRDAEAVAAESADVWDRPVVRVRGGRLPEEVALSEQALIDSGEEIFQRSGQLVRVARITKSQVKRGSSVDRQDNAIVLLPVDGPWLELRLTKRVDYQKFDSRRHDWAHCNCPPEIIRTMMSNSGGWRFRPLAGIIEAPTMRPDGSILSSPGYDEASGLYLDTGGLHFPPVPESPTRQEAISALAEFGKVIEEFDFKDATHRTAAISAILTALVRRSLRTAPLFGITAPKPGSGKSLLADVAALIATGRTAPAIPHTSDPAEEKKRLMTLLMEGDGIALIDNVESGGLSSDALCSILTQETYKDRILGESRTVSVPTAITWMATGNNLTARGDMSTRIIMIRIDPGVERPEERSFRRNLKEWIPQHRARLVTAGLTVLRAYAAAGRPDTGLPTYGRFEEWARVVRDALVWCGEPDPCATRAEVEDNDPVRNELGTLLMAWADIFGQKETTAANLIAQARYHANPPQGHWSEERDAQLEPNPVLLNALQDIAGDVRGEINTRKLGWWLKKYRGRIEGGLKISSTVKKDRNGIELWSVSQINDTPECGVSGFCGVSPIPHMENVRNALSRENDIHTYRAGKNHAKPRNPAPVVQTERDRV